MSVVGNAAVPTSTGTDQVTYTIAVGSGSIDNAVLHAHQPTGLPAQSGTVTVNGVAAPGGTVDQAGAGLTIRLGTGADAVHGGTLTPGNYAVTFDITVTTLPTGQANAYAVLDYMVNGQARHATSAPISLSVPDLRLVKPNGSGENRTLPLGTGADGDFEAILTNGGGDAPAATLTITLPAGLTIDQSFGVYRDDDYRSARDSGGVRLACTTVQANVVRCALGAVAGGANALVDVPVQPTPSAPVGQVGTFTLNALADSGLEADPRDNTVSGSVRFTGTAHLAVTLAPKKLRVVVGKTGAVTATVKNKGPNTAPNTVGLIIVRGNHFRITHFSGKQFVPGGGGATTLARARWGARSSHSATAAATPAGVPIVLWKVGTIKPGKSVKAVVTVKARAVGKDELLVAAGSLAGDPACQSASGSVRCQSFAIASLRAVRAPAHHPSSGGSSSPASPQSPGSASSGQSGPNLADTGPARAGSLAAFGGLAIAVGALLLVLGSVRPTHRHRSTPWLIELASKRRTPRPRSARTARRSSPTGSCSAPAPRASIRRQAWPARGSKRRPSRRWST